MYYMVIFIELPPGSVYIISQVKLTGLIRPGHFACHSNKIFHSFIYRRPLSWGHLAITNKCLVPNGVRY